MPQPLSGVHRKASLRVGCEEASEQPLQQEGVVLQHKHPPSKCLMKGDLTLQRSVNMRYAITDSPAFRISQKNLSHGY